MVKCPVHLPNSLTYYCKTCGDIWGRIWVEGATWQNVDVPCERHEPLGVSDWGTTPGSLLMGSLRDVGSWAWAGCVEYLPLAVLKREFEVHMNDLQREETNA